MKSCSTPQEKGKDDVEHAKVDNTPQEIPLRPGNNAQSPRPHLMRSPPGRLSDISQKLVEREDSQLNKESAGASNDAEIGKRRSSETERNGKDANSRGQALSAEEERVAKLRDAMNAKILHQQRMHRSYGDSRPQSSSTRVSPIQEEDNASGTMNLNAAFASPPSAVRTNSTVSTESTESNKTVRASQPATPAGSLPVRTPSYPFPYVPGTPKAWGNLHQPFTALSPTTTAGVPRDKTDTPGNDSGIISGGSTPAPTTNTFLPSDSMFQGPEDPRFPTPNLYDLVLQLNSEPGLEQWWTTVTNLMHDHYSADRVTLVMPLDPTDIENVPWGQKATFSMNGPEEFVSQRTVAEQVSNATAYYDNMSGADSARRESSVDVSGIKGQKLHPERLRPRLEARHSYAGHGREAFNEASMRSSARPAGPQRTVTHTAGVAGGVGSERLPPRRFPSTSTIRHGSLSDPEFSSIGGGIDAGPYAEVFPALRGLDHEVRPLIESSGVCRVLDRGRVVTVTRGYLSENSDSSNGTDSRSTVDGLRAGQPTNASKPAIGKLFDNYWSVFASDNVPPWPKDYEEFEQYATSPWSQSPAPSPAIQADEENNPFFNSEEQVEDSFNPANTPKDYSQLGQVEAIGVDVASTVIHIPLVHPTQSKPMQSLRTYSQSNDRSGPPKRSNTLDVERKAPIAILSVLSSAVPYPHNLTQSLKLLGPHLATSLSISQQFSSSIAQAVSIRHRRTVSGHNITNAPMTIEPTSLEEIVNADIEGAHASFSGSVTSPSEYSSRSKHSPTGSIVGTPGWDPATHGWPSSKSVSGTPGLTGTEIVDNYFEAKKRSGHRNGSNANTQVHSTPVRQVKRMSSSDGKQSSHKLSPMEENAKSPRSERKPKNNNSTKEEKSPRLQVTEREHSPPRSRESTYPPRPPIRHSISESTELSADQRHTQLHSYGADYESSFGGLPSSALESRTPGELGHGRKTSYPEDMPPPSERLLRTIIDSVPVQIFTAEPETGRLTWVNTKFLVYRGQEAREVLSEPWQPIHPDDRSEFMASWHRSLRTTQQLQQKVRLERFDGSYRWFYVRAAPLKDKRQKIVHWIGTMMDFHEQHIAEMNSARQQETAASEAKYRALANSSPQIVFAVNKARGVIFCNTQWVHYSGQSESQALGVGFMDHVHPDDIAKCRLPTFEEGSDQPKNVPTSVLPELNRKPSASAASSSGSSETEKGASSVESSPITTQMPQRKLSELASTGIMQATRDADGRPSYSTEVRLKSKDGQYRWHLVRVLLAEPLLQSGADEETWYGTCTDINDHKALERDLKETMDEKSRFLSNMSHEIRTPLNGIMGMIAFLIDSSLTSEQLEHLNIIRASTEGLRGLINDILDLSKAEAGMISLSMDWLYVRALIEEVNDLTSTMAIDKGLELNYLVQDDVPAQIKGDRFRIRQILLNIVGNAIKFTQRGEVFVRCSIQQAENEVLAENELFLRFDVIDTGRGFTDKEADQLFKRFSQIDGSSTRQHGGTGLGLVISQQLAQLHGGDMSARGVPGKGATFTLSIKTTIPTKIDQPPPLPTPGFDIPILPVPLGPITTASTAPKRDTSQSTPMPLDSQAKQPMRFTLEQFQSPSPFASPDVGRESTSASSASSDPSVKSSARTASLRSERSSASSFMRESAVPAPPVELALPSETKLAKPNPGSISTFSGILPPPMYSILILCPLKYSREATQHHIDKTLPENVPHQITARDTLAECQELIASGVVFSHVVIVLHNVDEIVALVRQVLASAAHQSTSIVIITDLAQRKKIMDQSPDYDYEQLANERRLLFVFKPLKPSRFASIFDPQKEREMSTDRNQDSAQQVALTQKQVFDEIAGRLGDRGKRVLLVEDNKTNQLVVMKFLKKVSIEAETALDGVECIESVFPRPHGYFSIILCDLHMPNKDGYQTCKEIRKWERHNKYPSLPIVALSANVLGDVYEKCIEAGFNSYLTKPVDFKELSKVLMTFMDPSDPSKPHEFMKVKRRQSAALGRKGGVS